MAENRRQHAESVVNFDGAEDPRAAIYQAIGAGSVCWTKMHRQGIFESERACAVAEALIRRLADFGLLIDGPEGGQ